MCLASDIENKVLGEQQADVPLEVKQQHLASHGGTDGKCKNNASKGGAGLFSSHSSPPFVRGRGNFGTPRAGKSPLAPLCKGGNGAYHRKLNDPEGGGTVLRAPANDDGIHLLRPVVHHTHAGASGPTPDHGPAAPASVAYRDSLPYPVHQPRSHPYWA
jgi:hypothetical protein